MVPLWPVRGRRRYAHRWPAPASHTRPRSSSGELQERRAPDGSTGLAPDPRWPVVTAVCAIVAVGALVRTRLFLTGRALWYDEAALALNVVGRSYLDLLGPLDFRQTAPP